MADEVISYFVQKMERAEDISGGVMSYVGPEYAQKFREWIALRALDN